MATSLHNSIICIQDDRIRDLCKRVDKLEERVDTVKEDLATIKQFQVKLLWGMIGVLLTSGGTMLLLILKLKGVG